MTHIPIFVIPPGAIRLDQCTWIVDEAKFVESHQGILDGSSGEGVKEPYKERLRKYNIIKEETK